MIKLQIDKPYKKNCTTSLMMLVQAYTYRRNRLEPCGRNAEGRCVFMRQRYLLRTGDQNRIEIFCANKVKWEKIAKLY
jgi:hypothetical protein